MKQSGFNRVSKKMQETDAQKQVRDEYAAAKKRAKNFSTNKSNSGATGKYYKGVYYPSTWELTVYKEHEYLELSGTISNLESHAIIEFFIVREDGEKLRETIEVDLVFFDNNLKRWCRKDAKPPRFRINKNGTKTDLDRKRKDWFLRWEYLQFLQPDYVYEIIRMHSGWRDYEDCSGNKI